MSQPHASLAADLYLRQCPACQFQFAEEPDSHLCPACGESMEAETFVLPLHVEQSKEHMHILFAVLLPLGLALLMFAASGWQHGWMWVGVFGALSIIAPLSVAFINVFQPSRADQPNCTLVFTSSSVIKMQDAEVSAEAPYARLGGVKVQSLWRGGYRLKLTTRAMSWLSVPWIEGEFIATPEEAVAVQEEIQRRLARTGMTSGSRCSRPNAVRIGR